MAKIEVIDNYGTNSKMEEDCVNWIKERASFWDNNGLIVVDQDATLKGVFGMDGAKETIADFAKLGIRVKTKATCPTNFGGPVLLLYPTLDLLNEVSQMRGAEEIRVLGWGDFDLEKWALLNGAKTLSGGVKKQDDQEA